MKFSKKKCDGLEGTIVVFTNASAEGDFQIVASRKGIQFIGRSETVSELGELRAMAEAIDSAFREHKSLVPKLVRPGTM